MTLKMNFYAYFEKFLGYIIKHWEYILRVNIFFIFLHITSFGLLRFWQLDPLVDNVAIANLLLKCNNFTWWLFYLYNITLVTVGALNIKIKMIKSLNNLNFLTYFLPSFITLISILLLQALQKLGVLPLNGNDLFLLFNCFVLIAFFISLYILNHWIVLRNMLMLSCFFILPNLFYLNSVVLINILCDYRYSLILFFLINIFFWGVSTWVVLVLINCPKRFFKLIILIVIIGTLDHTLFDPFWIEQKFFGRVYILIHRQLYNEFYSKTILHYYLFLALNDFNARSLAIHFIKIIGILPFMFYIFDLASRTLKESDLMNKHFLYMINLILIFFLALVSLQSVTDPTLMLVLNFDIFSYGWFNDTFTLSYIGCFYWIHLWPIYDHFYLIKWLISKYKKPN